MDNQAKMANIPCQHLTLQLQKARKQPVVGLRCDVMVFARA